MTSTTYSFRFVIDRDNPQVIPLAFQSPINASKRVSFSLAYNSESMLNENEDLHGIALYTDLISGTETLCGIIQSGLKNEDIFGRKSLNQSVYTYTIPIPTEYFQTFELRPVRIGEPLTGGAGSIVLCVLTITFSTEDDTLLPGEKVLAVSQRTYHRGLGNITTPQQISHPINIFFPFNKVRIWVTLLGSMANPGILSMSNLNFYPYNSSIYGDSPQEPNFIRSDSDRYIELNFPEKQVQGDVSFIIESGDSQNITNFDMVVQYEFLRVKSSSK